MAQILWAIFTPPPLCRQSVWRIDNSMMADIRARSPISNDFATRFWAHWHTDVVNVENLSAPLLGFSADKGWTWN
jgi:hypothetical protein